MVFLSTIFLIFTTCCVVSSECTFFKEKEHNMRKRNAESEKGKGAHFGYGKDNGPLTWKGVCQTGRKQSPINIELGTVIPKNYPSFRFNENYLKKQSLLAVNNGHTIMVTLENKENLAIIFGGGLYDYFVFQQLHFHWESEHEFDGKRADLEMHMVHYNQKYRSFAEAAENPDGVVVLAVLFSAKLDGDNMIEDFFAYILNMASSGPRNATLSPGNSLQKETSNENHNLFSLRDLLPKQTSRFFRYEGSLTTPGCNEVVQWTVFVNRLPVSRQVLKRLRTFRNKENQVIENNFRPPQKLNGREVFIQLRDYNEDAEESESQRNISNITSVSHILLAFCYSILQLKFYRKFIYI